MNSILVAPTNAFGRDVTFGVEVSHDALGGTFGDADADGHIAEAHFRIGRQAEEDVSVIGEEGPVVRHCGSIRLLKQEYQYMT